MDALLLVGQRLGVGGAWKVKQEKGSDPQKKGNFPHGGVSWDSLVSTA
jgi:hypothetical protein